MQIKSARLKNVRMPVEENNLPVALRASMIFMSCKGSEEKQKANGKGQKEKI